MSQSTTSTSPQPLPDQPHWYTSARSVSLGDVQITTDIFWLFASDPHLWVILGSPWRVQVIRIDAERPHIIEKSFASDLLCGAWIGNNNRLHALLWRRDGSSHIIQLDENPPKPQTYPNPWPWTPSPAASCAAQRHGDALWWVVKNNEHIAIQRFSLQHDALSPVASWHAPFPSKPSQTSIQPLDPHKALVFLHAPNPTLWLAQTQGQTLSATPQNLPKHTTQAFSDNQGGLLTSQTNPPNAPNAQLIHWASHDLLSSPNPLGPIPPDSFNDPPLSPSLILLTPRLVSPVGQRVAAVLNTNNLDQPLLSKPNITRAALLAFPNLQNPLLISLQRTNNTWTLDITPVPNPP